MKVEPSSAPVRVRVLNVSGTGMGLKLDSPIDPGTKVRIALSQTIVKGEICFCRLEPDQSYEAGLLITDVTAIPAGQSLSTESALLTVSSD